MVAGAKLDLAQVPAYLPHLPPVLNKFRKIEKEEFMKSGGKSGNPAHGVLREKFLIASEEALKPVQIYV